MNNDIKPYLFLFLIPIVSLSCSSQKQLEETTIEYKLVVKDNKTFILDEETAFDDIDGKYIEIDNKGYYSFFNRKNHSLYFYEYATGKLYHQIKLAKEGPDQIEIPYYFFEYWVHDFDNVFINTLAYQYRINKEGKVLKRIKEKREGSFFNKKNFSFDAATSYENGKLYTSAGSLIPLEGDTSWRRAIYDFDKDAYEKEYVNERILVADYDEKLRKLRDMSRTGGVSSLPIYFAGSHANLYGTTAINDSLYLFSNAEFKQAFYAGDPNIKVTDLDGFFNKTKVENLEGGGVRIGPKVIQPAFYNAIFHSPDKIYVYRILIHGTKPYINPESNKEEPKIIGASLVIFNTDSKNSATVELPVEQISLGYNNSDIFVSKEGIHFPVKETESEEEKSYYLYAIER